MSAEWSTKAERTPPREESETPRVDAALEAYLERSPMGSGAFEPTALARQLERELTAAIAAKQEAERREQVVIDRVNKMGDEDEAVREVLRRFDDSDGWYTDSTLDLAKAAVYALAAAERDNAALRADARRYAWLRDGHNAMLLLNSSRWTSSEQMDAAIDAASRQGKPNA